MSEQDTDPARRDDEVGAVSSSQPDVAPAEPETTEPPTAVEPAAEPTEPVAATPAPEPTPVVGAGEATAERPAGTARPLHAPPSPIGQDRPEVLVGAAFGGGLVAALLLKSLARRKHR